MPPKREAPDSEEEYDIPKGRARGRAAPNHDVKKRRKFSNGENHKLPQAAGFSLHPLLDLISSTTGKHEQVFEQIILEQLPEFIEGRERHLQSLVEVDQTGRRIRPLTHHEMFSLLQLHSQDAKQSADLPCTENLVARKLKLQLHRDRYSIKAPQLSGKVGPGGLESLVIHRTNPPNPAVIGALESIKSTPYARSFASRLVGHSPGGDIGFFARDWTARAPWTDLMEDIQAHYTLFHPECEHERLPSAPIDYQPLRHRHLPQLHDLLSRVFWTGIDVSDSLQNSPELTTVVATYRHLVVGGAFLSAPDEPYITYVVVRAGWEGAQIATKMLHHLLSRNPRKDVILHVSANNPAMLLYNQFGFKAEGFVVGFYEEYLDKHSRSSKNAFRLRLRR